MKVKIFSTLLMIVCSMFSLGRAAAEELTISITPAAKGPLGTMCNVVGNDGKPTGTKVIVRGFFADAGRMAEVHRLKVTSEGETMRVG